MAKPIIAVDIDDVLSASAEEFVRFSNSRFGTKLSIHDYHDDWLQVWRVDLPEALRRRDEYFRLSDRELYTIKPDAQASLWLLAKRFRLIVVTSRVSVLEASTQRWLDRHFPGLFETVHFSGIYDGKRGNINRVSWTKTELLKRLGAEYLIDDQYKHCAGAADAGIKGVLFGDYAWNRADTLPPGVTRCNDWAAVMEYFDGQ